MKTLMSFSLFFGISIFLSFPCCCIFSLVFDQFKMALKPEIIVPQIMVDYLGVEVVEIGGDANTECDNMGVFF